jgi:hypothetical protein
LQSTARNPKGTKEYGAGNASMLDKKRMRQRERMKANQQD